MFTIKSGIYHKKNSGYCPAGHVILFMDLKFSNSTLKCELVTSKEFYLLFNIPEAKVISIRKSTNFTKAH